MTKETLLRAEFYNAAANENASSETERANRQTQTGSTAE